MLIYNEPWEEEVTLDDVVMCWPGDVSVEAR